MSMSFVTPTAAPLVSRSGFKYFFARLPKSVVKSIGSRRLVMVSGPPLPKKKLGFSLGSSSAPVELQVFLDYCCPFSRIAYLKLVDSIIPAFSNQLLFVFQNQIQPWHPQSALMHEASLAIGLIAKEKFFDYSRLLFEHQEEFFDQNCYNKSRREIYRELANLATKINIPEDKMLNLLSIRGTGNDGNQVQTLMKFAIKYSRKLGVHVSPTYFVNGIEDTAAGSAWNKEEWLERLQPLL
ncbi:hypothetical protein GpartN1_g5535.t1 [Galdieria partita]|uniref:Thioredoxin-like fold domain-containing protein n=1 Tax=Galdieria partita TaxID=83374 RepID=A0A9C7Q0V9_9RHOD|nr:hypothetical protein GpartN1_g5535.t1 [Galdieria partita]